MNQDKSFHDDYDAEKTEVVINSRRYYLLVPSRIEPFVDPLDTMAQFPLWAKVWPASVLLAEWVAQLKPDPQKTLLEIGGGLGLPSIVAASCGHRITLSEANTDALRFARASAGLNRAAPLRLVAHDWRRPGEIGRFDLLIGSEVVYREDDVLPLMNVFDACLAPGGQIVLAGEIRRTTGIFLKTLSETYDIGVQRKRLRSEDETIEIALFRLRPKDSA